MLKVGFCFIYYICLFPVSVFASTGDVLEIPNFKIIFQSPTYLLDAEVEKSNYDCDGDKEECKVNFKLLEGDDTDISTKFSCSIDFGFPSTESEKCNPNTVIFPEGNHDISFKVFEKGNESNVKSKSVIIQNISSVTPEIIEPIIKSSPTIIYQTIEKTYEKPVKRELVIQSGLNAKNECEDEKCKLNLKYEGVSSDRCEWNFGQGEYKENYKTTCNPSYVYYKTGKHTISLKTYDVNNIQVFADFLEFQNDFIIEEIKKQKKEISPLFKYINISNILVNPEGYDANEYIEIYNSGTGKINIKGMIIDDIIQGGSRPYEIESELWLEGLSYMKFGKNITKIGLDNIKDEVNILFDNKNIDSLSWNNYIPEKYDFSHNSLEYTEHSITLKGFVGKNGIQVELADGTLQNIELVGVELGDIKQNRAFEKFETHIIENRKAIFVQSIMNYKHSYNSWWGYVYIEKINGENIFLNEELIKFGFAKAYQKYPFEYAEEFKIVQNFSEENELGIWKKKNNMNEGITAPKKVESSPKTESLSVKNIPNSKKSNKIKFTKNIKKQIKSLRIDGITLPNADVQVRLGDQEHHTLSNNLGKYAFNIVDLITGAYDAEFTVLSSDGNIHNIVETKPVILEYEYVRQVEEYNTDKEDISYASIPDIIPTVQANNNEKIIVDKKLIVDKKIGETAPQAINSLWYIILFLTGCTGILFILKKKALI